MHTEEQLQATHTRSKEIIEQAQTHDVVVPETHHITQPEQVKTPLDAMLERAMFDKEFDLDRLERMILMRDNEIKRIAQVAFNDSMAHCQQQMQSVVASQVNTHTKSLYAALDDIHLTCKPIWTKYGFSVTGRPQASDKPNHVKVILKISHNQGHWEEFAHDWPLDTAGAQGTANKTPIQGTGSTLTYARRYSECLLFDIAIARQDTDGNAAIQEANKPTKLQSINRKQEKALRDKLKKAGMSIIEFCQKGEIEELKNLEQGRVNAAMQMLDKRIIKAKNGVKK